MIGEMKAVVFRTVGEYVASCVLSGFVISDDAKCKEVARFIDELTIAISRTIDNMELVKIDTILDIVNKANDELAGGADLYDIGLYEMKNYITKELKAAVEGEG